MRVLITFLLLIMGALGHSDQGTHEEYVTNTGKVIRVIETHPIGLSLSNIRITSQGFEHEFDEIFEDADPIKDVLVVDLDGNGYDEIYIITVAAGSGSYGQVIGAASNRDRSLSLISFPEIAAGDPVFQGYMGHDVFTVEKGRLVRAFPIYGATDSNAAPAGGTKKVFYALSPGEAMWQLKIESVETVK